MGQDITVPVKLDEKTFKRFARFDMLYLRRRWVRPAVFALILIVFAVIALLTGREQSGMIAAVLLAVGIGLPVVYVGGFLSQVNMQAVQHRLKPPRKVYTVRMGDNGITVENNQQKEQALQLAWKDIPQAFRARKCIYLYVSPAKAFLLPDGQANVSPDEVWACLTARMGPGRCRKA